MREAHVVEQTYDTGDDRGGGACSANSAAVDLLAGRGIKSGLRGILDLSENNG
jgi:hypothetical protein